MCFGMNDMCGANVGKPMKTPWRIATNSYALYKALPRNAHVVNTFTMCHVPVPRLQHLITTRLRLPKKYTTYSDILLTTT